MFLLGDRITVLRDGKKVATVLPAETTPDELVQYGRPPGRRYTPSRFGRQCGRDRARSAESVRAERHSRHRPSGARRRNRRACGSVGSGRTEVARAIFGADRVTAGEIRLFGRTIGGSEEGATRRGMALIPENRKTQGLALARSVGDNIVLAGLDDVSVRAFSALRQAIKGGARDHRKAAHRHAVAAPAGRTLSGGNQQKVVIGKWLNADARFFIFDEPTRGIDVGAKAEIFRLLDGLVHNGAAVLMISSEQIEIVHICDRAYVMRSGRIAGELAHHELTEANIVRLGMHQ